MFLIRQGQLTGDRDGASGHGLPPGRRGALGGRAGARAQPARPARPAAQFEGKDTLLRPEGYREWVFVGSSQGLRYDEGKKQPEPLEYKNVYIDPAAYRVYKETGAFPQGTVLVLETAAGEEKKE